MKIFPLLFLIFVFGSNVLAQKKPITIYLAGDSTMAQKTPDKRPETGWGEKLQQYFDLQNVVIDNRALNGRSTKSFIDEGHWKAIVDNLKKGDYVFIEFGHNDEKSEDPSRYAAPNTDYRNNLIKFINATRAKNATPILLTPVVRRKFDENGNLVDTHGDYPNAVRKVAQEYKVPLIDMNLLSEKVLKSLGAEKSRLLFLQLKPNENPNYPKGVEDNTHFNSNGAEEMAKLAVAEIKNQKMGVRKYLKK